MVVLSANQNQLKKQLKGKRLAKGEYAAEMWRLQQANQKRGKKPRQQKWWSMSMLSLPVMRLLESENKAIDKARIADLERSVEHKKKLARAHLEAGREGKANKMANRARANDREIAKLKRMI